MLIWLEKQASLLAATAQATEVSELKQADEDIVLINKRLDEAQGMLQTSRVCLYECMNIELKLRRCYVYNCGC